MVPEECKPHPFATGRVSAKLIWYQHSVRHARLVGIECQTRPFPAGDGCETHPVGAPECKTQTFGAIRVSDTHVWYQKRVSHTHLGQTDCKKHRFGVGNVSDTPIPCTDGCKIHPFHESRTVSQCKTHPFPNLTPFRRRADRDYGRDPSNGSTFAPQKSTGRCSGGKSHRRARRKSTA